MKTITIVLVDDHQILRQGVKNLLEDEPGLTVIGEAASGEDGIDVVEKLRPDILITDLIMRGIDGIEMTREVRKRSPATNTIVLSMYDESDFVDRALQEGAKGYILKGSGVDELIKAIRQVAAGGSYLGTGVRR